VTTRITDWIDQRLGLTGIYDTVLDRKVPKVNWAFTLGSASLFLAVLQGATGIFLTVYYVPHPDQAYDSINYIMNEVQFGWLIRGIHSWSANLMVGAAMIHMFSVFLMKASDVK
jgi:quinol-cytochrome oxidoreductase complex cytochrome b subunit